MHLSYDAGGRVETVSRDGEMLRFEYDENDQLTKVSDVNGNPIIEYTYDSESRRVGGKTAISELNSAKSIQHHLASIRRYVGVEAKDYVFERIGKTFYHIILSSFNTIVL